MDPLSFTASLMTVSGVTIMASKLVYTLREKVENAPKDVGDLLEELQTFQELLDELKTQLQDSRDNAATQRKLLQIWGQSVAHMQRDVTSLHTKLSKLEQLMKKKSMGSRALLSARLMLSEKKIAEYQTKIYGHCVVLTCIKGTICDQKLSRLKQNTIQLGNDNRAGFQTISSQVSQVTGHLEAQARAGFSNISSNLMSAKSASDEMHRDLQSRMDDHAEREDIVRQNVDEIRCKQMRTIEINEAGFQAVQSALVTAASFNLEAHQSTHTMLRQQEDLMQQLGNHLAFGNSRNCVRSSRTRSDTWDSITPKTTLFWKTRYHSLPLGILRISINQTRKCKGVANSASPESTESNIEVTFVPPKWLTCIAVDYRMNLGYDSIGDRWHWGASLRPLTVNQNPFVIRALESPDFGAIQKSFREGLIHPSDYVLRWGEDLAPWYTVLGTHITKKQNGKAASLLAYMGENGLPGTIAYFGLKTVCDALVSDELIKHSCRKYSCNYMCLAIRQGLGSVVKLLLQNGAYANTMSTWLMFSIDCGTASCTETLIQHGADVNFLDGAGRSAFQVATSHMNAPHPRISKQFEKHWDDTQRRFTAEQDKETLAVVKRALDLKAQSTAILKEQEPECGFEVALHDRGDKTMPGPQNMFEKALGFFCTYYTPPLHEYRVRPHYCGIGDLWSMTFYEALLVRLFYVLSYVLLLAMAVLAFIRGDKRVRMPSRSILSAGALLLLAFIWGSSLQMNLPLKLDNGRSATKQEIE